MESQGFWQAESGLHAGFGRFCCAGDEPGMTWCFSGTAQPIRFVHAVIQIDSSDETHPNPRFTAQLLS